MIVLAFTADGRPLVWRRVVDPAAADLLAALLADAGDGTFPPMLPEDAVVGEIDLDQVPPTVSAAVAAIRLALADAGADRLVDATSGGAMPCRCPIGDPTSGMPSDAVSMPDAGEEHVA